MTSGDLLAAIMYTANKVFAPYQCYPLPIGILTVGTMVNRRHYMVNAVATIF